VCVCVCVRARVFEPIPALNVASNPCTGVSCEPPLQCVQFGSLRGTCQCPLNPCPPAFNSVPLPRTNFDFGLVVDVSTPFNITIMNGGGGFLSVLQYEFEQGSASWFSTINLPFADLPGPYVGQADFGVICAPPVGNLLTNTADMLTIEFMNGQSANYSFQCEAAPIFTSTPPPSPVAIALVSGSGGNSTTSIVFTNAGSAALTVSPNFVLGPWFSVGSGLPFTIGAKQSQSLTVSCSVPANNSSTTSQVLSFTANDDTSPTYTVTCAQGPAIASMPQLASLLDFGLVTDTALRSVTLQNVGYMGLVVSLQSLPMSSWYSVSGLPISGLSSQASSTITITCAPSLGSTMPQMGTLILSTNDITYPTINFTLLCTPGPLFYSEPPPLSTIALNATYGQPNSTTIDITDLGVAPLSVMPLPFVPGSWFGVSPSSMSLHPFIAQGLSVMCTVPVGVHPIPYTETLVLATSDPAQPIVSFTLSCTAGASYTAAPPPGSLINFGFVNSSSIALIHVYNAGSLLLDLYAPAPLGNASSWFSVSGLPVSGLSGPFDIAVNCTPTLATLGQTQNATLTFGTNDIVNPTISYTFTCTSLVSGVGVVSLPLPASPIVITTVQYLTGTATLGITNYNSFNATLSASFVNATAPVFSTLPVTPISLGPNGTSTTLRLGCTPLSDGTQFTATLLLESETNSYNYSIVCNSQASVTVSTPGPLMLGMLAGGTSSSQSLTVKNESPSQVDLSLSLQVDGGNNSTTSARRSINDGTIVISPTGIVSLIPPAVSLPPGSSTVVVLTIVPLAAFTHSTSVFLQTPSMSAPVNVLSLSWLAVVATISFVGPHSISLGPVPVGAPAARGSVVFTNSGNAPLIPSSVFDTTTMPSQWLTLVSTLPSVVQPTDQVSVTLACAPSSTGMVSATWTIQSNALGQPDLFFSVTCVGTASCTDGFRNQGETGIDCGGPCPPCSTTPTSSPPVPPAPMPPSPPPPTPMSPPSIPPGATLAPPSTNSSTTTTPANPPVSNGTAAMVPSTSGTSPAPISQPLLPASSPPGSIAMTAVQPVSSNQVTVVVVTDPAGKPVATVALVGDANKPTVLIVSPVAQTTIDSANAASGISSSDLGSLVIDVTLANGTSQLQSPATICLQYRKSANLKNSCLAYINGNNQWQCTDNCLTKNTTADLLCGTTSHFTNFAVLLSGPSDGCKAYVTGSWQGDLALVASLLGFTWGLAFLACLGFLFDWPYTRFIRGHPLFQRRGGPSNRRSSGLSAEVASDISTINKDDYYS